VPEIDGCIDGQIPAGKPSEIMVTSFSDADVYGTHGYFAVAAVQRHGFEYPQFDFAGGLGQDIELKPIPRPQLYLVTRTSPGAYAVQLRPPLSVNVAEGFFSDGSTTLGDVVVGYKIYKRDQLDRRPPTDRHRNAWTPVTDIVPLGQIATFTYTCLGQLTTYLATSIVYENGFETSYVSANSLPLRMCLDCVDDLDGDGWSNGDICGHEDCNDDDTSTYPTAAEANDGKDNQCPGDRGYGLVDDVAENAGFFHPGDTTRFTWLVQDGASQYEVGRSAVRDFSTGCRGFATQRPSFRDAETPQPGGVFYYLVRPSIPHTGSWGRSSTGVERVPVCS
jgi:hypothetical protein